MIFTFNVSILIDVYGKSHWSNHFLLWYKSEKINSLTATTFPDDMTAFDYIIIDANNGWLL